MNANIPFILKIDTDLLVGLVIREGSGGDAGKQAAHAALVVAIANAILVGAKGDVTSAIAAVDAIALPAGTDPAKAAVIQTVIAWVASKAASLQLLLSGSVLGVGVSDMLASVAVEAIAVANKYIPQPVVPPAAA